MKKIPRRLTKTLKPWLTVTVIAVTVFLSSRVARASSFIDVERLADAIYLAEGGAKTAHPYGILAKYKTTTPRQACINTIRHAFRDWDKRGDFISYLGARYAPVGASNDPRGLNKNWVKNVHYFYRRGK